MTATLSRSATASASRPATVEAVRSALDSVFDPELDEPITDLGFVRSVEVDPDGAAVIHLRLPTSFCSPNFAWIMASDARDAVTQLDGVRSARVELDDHHDSDLINGGLARNADYRATFGHEAEDSLDELRATFRRKAHVAAMERALTDLLRARSGARESDLAGVTVGELPAGSTKDSLVRRRAALGFSTEPSAVVLVDDDGTACPPEQAERRMRMARSVRISIDGNAHFCRGLLATRYPGAEADQAPRAADRPLLPLLSTGV